MKRLLMIAAVCAAMTWVMSSCGESVNAGDLCGEWNSPKVSTEYGDLDLSLIFSANEADSTKGDVMVVFDGQWTDKDEDETTFSVRYFVGEMGTYQIDGNTLKITYIPDSLGVRTNLDDVLLHAQEQYDNGTRFDGLTKDDTILKLAREFKNSFTNFIGDMYVEEFKNRNKRGEEFTITIDGNTLVLKIAGDSGATINLKRVDTVPELKDLQKDDKTLE